MKNTPRTIAEIVDRYRKLLGAVNGNAASVLGTEGVALEEKLLAEVLKYSGTVRPEQVNQIRALLRDIIAQSSEKAGQLMAAHVKPGLKLVASRTRATTTALLDAVGHPRMRNALQAMREWEDRIETRAAIRTEFYAKRWARSWSDSWSANLRDVEDAIAEAALKRESWLDLSKRIAEPLNNIKEFAEGRLTPSGFPIGPKGEAVRIRGAVHPDAFARAYARTSMGELSQIEGVSEAHEIGLRYFANVGLPGPTQSAICFLACQEAPMTIEEWRRWRRNPGDPSQDGGLPKRHAFNCNDELIGCPQAAIAMDWRQPSPIWKRSSAEAHLLERMVA